MTYGWAILIIAVVLGALFQLGIFNASTFTPKAPPGACHVFRPNGPGTTSFINTQGICNGELPQYVAKFNGAGYVTAIPTTVKNSFTTCAWFNPSVLTGGPEILSSRGPGDYSFDMQLATPGNKWYNDIGTGSNWIEISGYVTYNFGADTWYQGCFAVTTTGWTAYVDGTNLGSGAYTSNTPLLFDSTHHMFLGQLGTGGQYFTGLMSNVQVYNASLSSNEIAALYNGGIGAAPIKLSNLVGWWPLNGDVKDYSGNNNNGAATAISFTSSWSAGYSAP